MLSLSFRDETTTVVKKYQNQHKSLEDESLQIFLAADQSPPGLSSPQSLFEPINEVAMAHFVNSFVSGSHFDYLPGLYSKTSIMTPLQSSMYASALANLARERCESDMMRTAQSYYGQALRQTKKALLSEQATQDSTLVSVLILSLYETIALSDQMSIKSWDTHTEGAVSLLQLRGLESLQTDMGQKLYIQVSNNIRVSCVQRAVPLPTRFIELDKQATVFLDHSNPVLQFWPIVDAFIHLQIMDRSRDLYEPMTIMKQALMLEQMLMDLTNGLSSLGVYEVLEHENIPKEAFEESAHWYKDHRVARLWNTIRMTRIFVNEVLYEQSSILLETQIPAESISWNAIQLLATETATDAATGILASVPQFIQKPKDQNIHPLRVSTVSGLVWPLSAVGASKLVSEEARKYAIQTLLVIGRDARLPSATKIAEKIEIGAIDGLSW